MNDWNQNVNEKVFMGQQLSTSFWLLFGCFTHSLQAGEFKYPEDVAIALDELALAAWKEVRELYPPSHAIEDDRPHQ